MDGDRIAAISAAVFIRLLVDYLDVIELSLQLAADVGQIFLVQLLLFCQLLRGKTGSFLLFG